MAEDTPEGLPVATWIAVYFESEDPDERDAIFTRIAQDPSEAASAFLAAMMAHDEDAYLRVAAAAQLWARGLPQAQTYLLDLLHNAPDDMVFEQALAGLMAHPDAALYDVLAAMYADPARDVAERRLAMLGMEHCDGARSLTAFRTALTAPDAPQALPMELLSAALAGLIRSATPADAAALQAFVGRVQTVTWPDADDKMAFRDLCAESVALMEAAAHPDPDDAPLALAPA